MSCFPQRHRKRRVQGWHQLDQAGQARPELPAVLMQHMSRNSAQTCNFWGGRRGVILSGPSMGSDTVRPFSRLTAKRQPPCQPRASTKPVAFRPRHRDDGRTWGFGPHPPSMSLPLAWKRLCRCVSAVKNNPPFHHAVSHTPGQCVPRPSCSPGTRATGQEGLWMFLAAPGQETMPRGQGPTGL